MTAKRLHAGAGPPCLTVRRGLPTVGPASGAPESSRLTRAVDGKRLDATNAGPRTALERLSRHPVGWPREPFSLSSSIVRRLGRMDMLMALAVSIGVLIALWVKFGGMIGVAIAVPAGIVAWACFYAAGGKTQGLQKAIASNVSGVIWVLLANLVISGAGLQSDRLL